MGFSYLKTVHGVLICVQILLLSMALLAGFLLWHPETHELYWMFFSGTRPLVSLVLVILTVLWLTALGIVVQQLCMRDLLEQLGKAKLLLLHGVQLGTVLLCAVIESYYLANIASGDYYLTRLIFVTVACWLLLITFVGQFVFVLCQ